MTGGILRSMALADSVRASLASSMMAFEQMAIDIGQLECLASDALLREEAEPLRQLVHHLRSTMDLQFDIVAADLERFPWWQARNRSFQSQDRECPVPSTGRTNN